MLLRSKDFSSFAVLSIQFNGINEIIFYRPSYYEIQIDGGPLEKQKSSGLCISTGTGSTAWSYNICKLHPTATRDLLRIAQSVLKRKNTDVYTSADDDVIEQGMFFCLLPFLSYCLEKTSVSVSLDELFAQQSVSLTQMMQIMVVEIIMKFYRIIFLLLFGF